MIGRIAGGTWRTVRRVVRLLAFPVVVVATIVGVVAIGMFPARAYLDQKQAIAQTQGELSKLQRDHLGVGHHRGLPRFASRTDCHSRSYHGVSAAAVDSPERAVCPPMTM